MFRPRAVGENDPMKNLGLASNSGADSGSTMNEARCQFLNRQLARVIAMNLMCLVVFIAFCAVMTFGSLTLLLSYWNEHRAASVIIIMIAIVAIPSLIEFAVSRTRFWQR
jgi:hypothetical protein